MNDNQFAALLVVMQDIRDEVRNLRYDLEKRARKAEAVAKNTGRAAQKVARR